MTDIPHVRETEGRMTRGLSLRAVLAAWRWVVRWRQRRRVARIKAAYAEAYRFAAYPKRAITAPCGCSAGDERACSGDCRGPDVFHLEPWCPTPGDCTFVLREMRACCPAHVGALVGIIEDAEARERA